MVNRVLEVVYREVRGLHQAAYVLAFFTLGSQILALIRDRILAHQFGAGIELDLYYTAFRIPDILYVLFASTLSVYVLIPFVAERVRGVGETRARALLSQIFTIFVGFYSVLALVIIVWTPEIISVCFPGFLGSHDELAALIRILMIQPLLLGISSLLGVVTQYDRRFILYAISPLLYNLGIILGALVLYPPMGLDGLVWGVVLGALAHVIIQIPYMQSSVLRPGFTKTFEWDAIREVLAMSLPRALTLSLHQLVLLVLIGFASVMTVGSVSVFQFAFNLQSVPLAIIGVSYSVAAFPLLAQLYAEEKFKEFGGYIMNALRHIIFWSLPVLALFIVVRAQFVRMVLGTGDFDWADTRLTAAILAIFALSLTAQSVHLLVVRALYAVGNTTKPFFVTLCSSVVALVASYAFYTLITTEAAARNALESIMRLEGVPGIEVLALPLGYSVALIFGSILLVFASRRELHMDGRVLFHATLRGIAAAVAGGFAAYTTLNFYATGIETNTLMTIFFQGLLASIAGLLASFSTYYIVQSEELREVYAALHKRLFKATEVVTPQDEDQLAL